MFTKGDIKENSEKLKNIIGKEKIWTIKDKAKTEQAQKAIFFFFELEKTSSSANSIYCFKKLPENIIAKTAIKES